jgi:hypothetical protein
METKGLNKWEKKVARAVMVPKNFHAQFHKYCVFSRWVFWLSPHAVASGCRRVYDVVSVFDEGDNMSIALRVGGPASKGLGISFIVRCIPFERLLEPWETSHPRN